MSVEVEFVDGRVLIHTTKGLLVLTRAELIDALKRGKAYRRAQALKARLEQPMS